MRFSETMFFFLYVSDLRTFLFALLRSFSQSGYLLQKITVIVIIDSFSSCVYYNVFAVERRPVN